MELPQFPEPEADRSGGRHGVAEPIAGESKIALAIRELGERCEHLGLDIGVAVSRSCRLADFGNEPSRFLDVRVEAGVHGEAGEEPDNVRVVADLVEERERLLVARLARLVVPVDRDECSGKAQHARPDRRRQGSASCEQRVHVPSTLDGRARDPVLLQGDQDLRRHELGSCADAHSIASRTSSRSARAMS